MSKLIHEVEKIKSTEVTACVKVMYPGKFNCEVGKIKSTEVMTCVKAMYPGKFNCEVGKIKSTEVMTCVKVMYPGKFNCEVGKIKSTEVMTCVKAMYPENWPFPARCVCLGRICTQSPRDQPPQLAAALQKLQNTKSWIFHFSKPHYSFIPHDQNSANLNYNSSIQMGN